MATAGITGIATPAFGNHIREAAGVLKGWNNGGGGENVNYATTTVTTAAAPPQAMTYTSANLGL